MTKDKNVEAQVTTAEGTTILIKGDKKDVAELLTVFAGHSSGGGTGGGAAAGVLSGTRKRDFTEGAEKDEDGNVHIVVTDLKAKNAMDAARRLIYVTLLARRELLQEKKTERATIKELLRSYNLYDGNTRNIIPKDRSLVREGRKYVSLSGAAVPIAGEFVKAIQDATI